MVSLLVLFAMAGGVGGALAPTVSWAGIPSTTGVRLAVRPADESASLVVSARRDLSAPVATYRVTRNEFVVDVQGLAPETQYYYGLAADSASAGGARAAEFRTPSASPRAPFRVAVGACGWSSGNGAVFANIAALEPRPLVFIHAGDLHYQDIGEDSLPRFEAAFQGVHAGEAAQLFRTVPLMYTWDDHDFGANNAIGSSPSRSAALAAFRKYVPATLAGEAGDADGGVYQSYEVQGVLFIVTDLRSRSDPSAGTTLGKQQREWLLRLLSRWREWRLIILVSSKPWLGDSKDSWDGYADERLVISNFIASVGVKNLVMVSGDAHMLAIDDGSNTDFSSVSGAGKRNASSRAGFPLLQAAPLTGYGSSKSGPYSHGCRANSLFLNHQFGIIDIDEGDASNLCVKLLGMTDSGSKVAMELKVCAGETDAGGTRGLVRKGTRSSNEGAECSLHLAPGGMIAMMAIGVLMALVSILLDVRCVLEKAFSESSHNAVPQGESEGESERGMEAPLELERQEQDCHESCRAFAARVPPRAWSPVVRGACWVTHLVAVICIVIPIALSLGPRSSKG